MSKAFTRESDDVPERTFMPRPTAVLPPGTKNYLTTDGARRLQEELDRLVQERPRVAAAPDGGDAKQRLQVIDRRVLHLEQSLRSAVIVPTPPTPWDQVRFGATITVRNHTGEESRYRIVGVDETDIDLGWVSWLSPIAKALLNARLGQRVRFKLPSGEEELELVSISYE